MNLLCLPAAVGHFGMFGARAVPAALFAFTHPREIARQLYVVLLGALPLGLAAGGAVGAVVWLHLHNVMTQGLKEKTPEYLAQAVLLEFAPLAAGMIVAGRTGASLGAELSSMKLTEQVDALESMGLPSLRYLVGPRVLACALSLPVLTLYIAFFALASSYLAEMAGGSLYSTQYLTALRAGIDRVNIVASTLKTVVFGYLIGCAGTYSGLTAPGGSEGVGVAATRGVVWSIFLVLASNVFLVKLLHD
jgi:phospholipid/cholesterol/gamma-HCH transport system permease protein